MSEKDRVRAEWLALCMKWYDRLDGQGKREMFEHTSKTASSRWTINELKGAMICIRGALDSLDAQRKREGTEDGSG